MAGPIHTSSGGYYQWPFNSTHGCSRGLSPWDIFAVSKEKFSSLHLFFRLKKILMCKLFLSVISYCHSNRILTCRSSQKSSCYSEIHQGVNVPNPFVRGWGANFLVHPMVNITIDQTEWWNKHNSTTICLLKLPWLLGHCWWWSQIQKPAPPWGILGSIFAAF